MVPRGLVLQLALLVATVALAGCSDSEPDTAPDSAMDEPDGTTTATPEIEEETPAEIGPIQRDLYFQADGTLAAEPGSAGTISIGTPTTGLATGVNPTEFTSNPFNLPVLLLPETITLTAFIQSDGPLVSNGLFDLAAWVGSEEAKPGFSFVTHTPVHAPGEPLEVSMTVNVPRGLYIDEGGAFQVFLSGTFLGGETGFPELVVGDEHPSRINLTWQMYSIDPLAGADAVEGDDLTGQVANSLSPTNCDAAPGTTSQTHDVLIEDGAVGLRLALQATSNRFPMADLDLDLFQGSTWLAGGHTPYDADGIFLADASFESMGGQTLTVKVSTCGTGPIDYAVDVTQFVLPSVDAVGAAVV